MGAKSPRDASKCTVESRHVVGVVAKYNICYRDRGADVAETNANDRNRKLDLTWVINGGTKVDDSMVSTMMRVCEDSVREH